MDNRQIVRPYRSLNGLAGFTTVFLILTFLLYCGFSIFVGSAFPSFFSSSGRVPASRFDMDTLRSSGWLPAAGVFLLFLLACALATWIAYHKWVNRAHSNLTALGATSFSNGTSWISRRYRIMREIWLASLVVCTTKPRQQSRPCWLVGFRWFFCLLAFVGFFVMYTNHSRSAHKSDAEIMWSECFFLAAYFMATVLTIAMVLVITSRLEIGNRILSISKYKQSRSRDGDAMLPEAVQSEGPGATAPSTLKRAFLWLEIDKKDNTAAPEPESLHNQSIPSNETKPLSKSDACDPPIAEVVSEPPSGCETAPETKEAPSPDFMSCPQCGGPLEVGDRFCATCGIKVPTFCPYCHHALKQKAKFCTKCGNRVDADGLSRG